MLTYGREGKGIKGKGKMRRHMRQEQEEIKCSIFSQSGLGPTNQKRTKSAPKHTIST